MPIPLTLKMAVLAYADTDTRIDAAVLVNVVVSMFRPSNFISAIINNKSTWCGH